LPSGFGIDVLSKYLAETAAAMRLRIPDPDERHELVAHLRAYDCMAYAVDGQQTIEALVLRPVASQTATITALVDDWRARRSRDRRPA
jgi:hypothetical protein